MYSMKYKLFNSKILKEGLSANELDRHVRQSNLASNLIAVNNITNKVVRPYLTKYGRVYYNDSNELFYKEDEMVDLASFNKCYHCVPGAIQNFQAILRDKTCYCRPRFLLSNETEMNYKFEYSAQTDKLVAVYARVEGAWNKIWMYKGEYLEQPYKTIKEYEIKLIEAKNEKQASFAKYKENYIRRHGFWGYNPDAKKIFILNEIKGVTDKLDDKAKLYKTARTRAKQTAMSLDTDTELQPAIIITSYHTFNQELVDCFVEFKRTLQKKTKTFIKSSRALTLAVNLYNTGCPEIKLIDYREEEEKMVGRSVVIKQTDNLWSKLQEFCTLWSTEGSIVSEIMIKEQELVKAKRDRNFIKYASIYNLDSTNLEHQETFRFLIKHPEFAEDFLDGTKFKCPHCGEIVHVNSHYMFQHGKFINTYQTICDNCGVEFDIHDKKDILIKILKQEVDTTDGYTI